MSRLRYAGLDSLRGAAVLAVVLFHSGALPGGFAGVDLFFGLSGFLITSLLLDAKPFAVGFTALARPFYARRAVRILPLAWAAVALAAIVTRDWRGAAWYGIYLANWLPVNRHPAPAVLAHFWSLCVEEQFYFVWPVLVFALSRRRLAQACVALWLFGFLASAWLWHIRAPLNILDDSTIASAGPLLVGSWLAVRAADQRLPAPSLAIGVGALLAFVWLAVPIRPWGPDAEGWVYLLTPVPLSIAVGAALVVTLAWGRDARPLARLGTISYGVYVIHGLILPWVSDHVATVPGRVAVLLGVSVVLAELSWRLLEQPILRLKKRWPMPSPDRSRRPNDGSVAVAPLAVSE